MKANKDTIRAALYTAIKAKPPVGANTRQTDVEWEAQQKKIIQTLQELLDELA